MTKRTCPSPPKPKLLLISPTEPRATLNGRAMRAQTLVSTLATFCEVHLLVVPTHREAREETREVAAPECHRGVQVQLGRDPDVGKTVGFRGLVHRLRGRIRGWTPSEWPSERDVRRVGAIFQDLAFDEIFVFRLYMLPFAFPYALANPGARLHLDLDDLESRTRRRIAALMDQSGQPGGAATLRREAEFYAVQERRALPKLGHVYVCSEVDRRWLRDSRGVGRAHVLPNVCGRAPPETADPRPLPFQFLFVGSLGYYPNQDAVRWFVQDIFPRVRARTPMPVEFTIVGTGATEWIDPILTPGCESRGRVEEVESCYARAHAAVVPLRAGGGTRLKILEAFAFGCPVVSTPAGAEGLEVHHGRELLIADDAETFAGHCLRLMEDAELRARLTANASDLIQRRYRPGAAQEALAPVFTHATIP